ncbi:hypothetical protein D9M73_179600 [compost metagenome]
MIGDVLRPWGRLVIVPAHDMQRRNRRQLLEDLRFADVAGVNDAIAAQQGGDGFGAKQAVGVGDDTDFHC